VIAMAFLCAGLWLCGFVAAMLWAIHTWNRHHDEMIRELALIEVILEGLENVVEPKD